MLYPSFSNPISPLPLTEAGAWMSYMGLFIIDMWKDCLTLWNRGLFKYKGSFSFIHIMLKWFIVMLKNVFCKCLSLWFYTMRSSRLATTFLLRHVLACGFRDLSKDEFRNILRNVVTKIFLEMMLFCVPQQVLQIWNDLRLNDYKMYFVRNMPFTLMVIGISTSCQRSNGVVY